MSHFFTSLAAALFMILSLKFLHLFHLIKWNPITFLKNVPAMEWTTFEKWFVLFIILIIISLLFYFVGQTLLAKSPFLFSLIIGVIGTLILEWRILDLPVELASFKKISIPLIVVISMTIRFIAETAQYMQNKVFR